MDVALAGRANVDSAVPLSENLRGVEIRASRVGAEVMCMEHSVVTVTSL
jgi:hypothetical protein